MAFRPCTVIMHAVAVAALLTALSAPRANAEDGCQAELAAVQNYNSAIHGVEEKLRFYAAEIDKMQSEMNQNPTDSHLYEEASDFRDFYAQQGTIGLGVLGTLKAARAGANQDLVQCLTAAIINDATSPSPAAPAAPPAASAPPPGTQAATGGANGSGNYVGQAIAGMISALTNGNTSGSNANDTNGGAGTGAGGSNNGQGGPTAANSPGPALPPGQSTSAPASGATAGGQVAADSFNALTNAASNAENYAEQVAAAAFNALTNAASNAGNNNAGTASNPAGQQGMSQSATGQSGQPTQSPTTNQPANNGPTGSSKPTQTAMATPSSTATPPPSNSGPLSLKQQPGTPPAATMTTATNITCSYSAPLKAASAVNGVSQPATSQSQTFGVAGACCPKTWCLNNDGTAPIDPGNGAVPVAGGQCNSNQGMGTLGGAWNLSGTGLPLTTATCSSGGTSSQVQACKSNPPYLPWGGTGSATITVSGGQSCGVGWHDTPGGPGGVTVLDSISVRSPPSRGTATPSPQDQHMIIFTPASGYKGPDSFTLSMQEHNGGRKATLSVKVSVTIQ